MEKFVLCPATSDFASSGFGFSDGYSEGAVNGSKYYFVNGSGNESGLLVVTVMEMIPRVVLKMVVIITIRVIIKVVVVVVKMV